jgi:hypothetical protein
MNAYVRKHLSTCTLAQIYIPERLPYMHVCRYGDLGFRVCIPTDTTAHIHGWMDACIDASTDARPHPCTCPGMQHLDAFCMHEEGRGCSMSACLCSRRVPMMHGIAAPSK